MMHYEESSKIELKELWQDQKILKAICAFLNTDGGTIYIGVDDKGVVKDLFDNENFKTKDDYLKRFGEIINSRIYPPVDESMVKPSFNEDGVLCIEVKKGRNDPYQVDMTSNGNQYYNGKFIYIRVGTTSRAMSYEEIKERLQKQFSNSFEMLESSNQQLTFNQLYHFIDNQLKNENNELNELKSLIVRNSNNTLDNWKFNDIIFNSLNIKNKDGKFTNLGELLSDQNKFSINVHYYNNGKEKWLNKDNKINSIILQIDKALNVLTFNYQISSTINNNGRRVDSYSYPKDSIREGIVNAVIHANYYKKNYSCIDVKVYFDRIEIISPGNIISGMTLNDILDNGMHPLRNRELVEFFSYVKLAEGHGNGLDSIKIGYDKYFKQFNKSIKDFINVSENSFKIVLPNLNKNIDKYEKDLQVGNNKLSINDLLEYIKDNNENGVRPKDIQNKFNVSRQTISRKLNILLKKKLITSKGNTTNKIIKLKK